MVAVSISNANQSQATRVVKRIDVLHTRTATVLVASTTSAKRQQHLVWCSMISINPNALIVMTVIHLQTVVAVLMDIVRPVLKVNILNYLVKRSPNVVLLLLCVCYCKTSYGYTCTLCLTNLLTFTN